MLKQWSVGLAAALLAVACPPAIMADSGQLWGFNAPGDTAGFHGAPANGSNNQVSWVGSPAAEGGGSLRIDFTGSKGFNAGVSSPTVPAVPSNTATISAQVYVPAEVTITRLELGLQVDGAPADKDHVIWHQLDTRGGWNLVAWSVHPGQLAGQHALTIALNTDDAMPAPLFIDDVRAVQPHITVDASHVISTFDPVALWGQNVAYYYPPSFFQDPAVIKLAQDAGYYSYRIPGGLNSDVYHWNGNGVRKPDGSINPAARRPDGTWAIDYSGYAPGFEVKGETSTGDPLFTSQPNFSTVNQYDHTPPVDAKALAHWISGLGPQAQILVDVNVGTASNLTATGPNNSLQESDVATGAQEAARWVRYYNQQLGAHVKYWEVGNELNPYGAEIGVHVRDGSPQGWHWITASDYATIFRAYARAMKAVDPGIQMAGPVGYLSAFGDASGTTSWIQTFLQQAGDVVDVIDIHFYNHGESEPQTMAKPADLQPEIDRMRGWLRQSFPQRADQVGIGVSEWGDYNNTYPIADGLYAADLMGQMARSQIAFGNAWDLANVIPDNGQPVPTFGFDSPHHEAGGWDTAPANGASNALTWTNDPDHSWPGHWGLVVDYRGSKGPNASLGHSLAGISVNPVANALALDVLIPNQPGNNTVTFWLRIERPDGTFDDSGRDQPQQPMWGEWNHILLPLDPGRLTGAKRVDVVVDSNLPMATQLYFTNIELQQSLHQPNGRYWAAYMYHHYFSNSLVAVDLGGASGDRLAAYASRSADGSLYLMVVNKDPVSDMGMPMSINGYKPAGTAMAYTWDGDNYGWDYATGHASKDDPPSARVVGAGASFNYVFPKYSITAIKLTPG
ncbi:MAG TPA: hypothetical protein VF157_02535 [Chloroflexota bacterium]